MNFNSLEYLLFFPVVTSVYFLMPHKWRWVLLLLASYYFYMAWVPVYVSFIILSTVVTYFSAIGIGASKGGGARRFYLLVSVVANMGILAVFKYYGFFGDSLRSVLDYLHAPGVKIPALKLLLPIGVSFHTFQAVGYTVDVYRGKVLPERHLGIFALFSCFFPQLVAGPIERSYHLLPMFRKKFDFDYDRVTGGLKLIAWGFFMKAVVADNLALYVNKVYNDPHSYTGLPLIFATYFFAFQIFCDFAGYTEIAIGTAKIMGFDLMENFERPYFAKSIAEFWRRWHISLSTWFRDYLYIPLGGNRVPVPRLVFNLMFVFLVCGLWHGADWKFVVWGGLHGVYMAFSLLTRRFRAGVEEALGLGQGSLLVKALKVFVTFNLVCFAWIFFRANSLADAYYIIVHIFDGLPGSFPADENMTRFAFYFLLIACILGVHIIQRGVRIRDYIITKPLPFRWAGYGALVLAIFFFGQFEGSDFIYFQF